MNLNVWKGFPYTKRHYLTHPHIFIRHCWDNLKAAWQRSTKGYANRDVWGMDEWILAVLPPMLRQRADCDAYPYGYTIEQWEEKLRSIADVFESVQEENWESRNEYAAAYNEILMRNFTMRNGKLIQDNNHDEIRDLYYLREEELQNERLKLIMDTAKELFDENVFPHLWN